MWDDYQWEALDYMEGQCIGHDEEWSGEDDLKQKEQYAD